MNKRKGFVSVVIVLFLLLFISTGNFFTSLLASQQIQHTISYSTNDLNQLAEAKAKEQVYHFNIRKEANYSANIVAVQDEEKVWDGSIPDNDTVVSEYLNGVKSHLSGQNRVADCSAPNIDRVRLGESDTVFTVNFSSPYIRCGAPSTTAFVKVQEEYEVNNTNNWYVNLTNTGVNLAEAAKRYIENNVDASGWGAESTATACNDRSGAKSSAKSSANSGARSAADYSIDESVLSNFNMPDYISVTYQNTSFDTETDVSSEQTSKCEYTADTKVCNISDYEDGCDPDLFPTTICNSTSETRGEYDSGLAGDEYKGFCYKEAGFYSATATANVSKIWLEFELTDSERQVLNSNGGLSTLDFRFEYGHSVND